MKRSLSHLYYINNQGKYECKVCGKIQNVCKHVRKKHIKSDEELSQFTYKGTKILKSTESILLWKVSQGISMASFNDKLIKDLLPPNSLKSDKTNQRIIDEMSSQIIE